MTADFVIKKSEMSAQEYVLLLVDALRGAKRLGDDKDEPEGQRYIVMSDTLANQICDKLEGYFTN